MKELYEKLGLFYLGKSVDEKVPTLVKSKDFTTHAAIIGMTGSGKTGLAIGLLEEAMIDNIPAIVIDPKGDMGNLCLRSADYDPEDFVPWVGEEKAQSAAAAWKKGIESFDQTVARSARLSRVPVTIYTPGSSAGVGVNILGSLDVPGDEIMQESDLFSSYLGSTVASLLSMIGETNDIQSKSYTFLCTLLASLWQKGEKITLERLIAAIISPPFSKVGFLALDDFFSSKERFALATRFNSVVANPSFAQWLEGVELDIDAMLYDENANAKVSIFSIAHLDDAQRMFFVTMLLNRYVAWMRRQSGTTTLRSLLYMDEIYGFFPPSKNPPSKTPMLLLLKQARAFGIGVVLSTQNPVDLDYKGLANIGTWFIGRLQTRQDVDRVIDGLSGKLGSEYSQEEIRSMIAHLDKRVFFIKSAHRERIERFTTRWVLSYLKGPLKRDEIKMLMHDQKVRLQPIKSEPQTSKRPKAAQMNNAAPSLEMVQYYEGVGNTELTPVLLYKTSLYYHNESKGIDLNVSSECEIVLEGDKRVDFTRAEPSDALSRRYPTVAPKQATFAELPSEFSRHGIEKLLTKALKDYLYTHQGLQMYRVRSPRFASRAGETYQAFSLRFKEELDVRKAAEKEKLTARYERKEAMLRRQLERAQIKVEKEESDVAAKTTDTLVSAGLAVLGAFFGGRSSSRIGSTVSKGTRIAKEKRDVIHAQEAVAELDRRYERLRQDLEQQIDLIDAKYSLENYTIEPYKVRPKKRDISIDAIALLWR